MLEVANKAPSPSVSTKLNYFIRYYSTHSELINLNIYAIIEEELLQNIRKGGKMKQKKIIIISTVIAILIIAFLGINWYVGNEAEQEMEKTLEKQAEHPQIDLSYSNVNVNPASRRATISNIEVTNNVSNLQLRGGEISFSSGIGEVMNLIQQEEIEELKSFTTEGKDLAVEFPAENFYFTLDSLNLNFDGKLNQQSLENVDYLLANDQQLSFSIQEAKLNNQQFLQAFLPPAFIQEGMEKIEEATLNLNYLSEEERLTLTDSRFNTSWLAANLEGDITLERASFALSEINQFEITLRETSEQIDGLIQFLELQRQTELPKDDDGNKIIKLEGILGQPRLAWD